VATALLHGRLLVLDEPFEAVDPVSAATVKAILRRFVDHGGSVVFSSHVMATVEQLCDSLAVMSLGTVRAAGPMARVRAGQDLEQRFVDLVGGRTRRNGAGSDHLDEVEVGDAVFSREVRHMQRCYVNHIVCCPD
jgi:ABC-2 type transport system ATP-binding protein